MIISNVTKVRTSDPSNFAWAKLRKFQNVELVADTIQKLHRVESKYRDNVKKQARQLRYCMIQAREYFTAAQSVSIATKPNLLYYGTMSLALAEILFKQSGESSLDRARDEHRHHGLTMTAGGIPKGAKLAAAAGHLRAVPLTVNGSRKGTFEIWHRSSREHPLCGYVYSNFEGEDLQINIVPSWGQSIKHIPLFLLGGSRWQIALLDCPCSCSRTKPLD